MINDMLSKYLIIRLTPNQPNKHHSKLMNELSNTLRIYYQVNSKLTW